MRGPAGVSDAGAAFDTLRCGVGFELRDACGAAGAQQLAVFVDGDAAGVVPPIFKAFEAFNEDRNDVAGADGADDATHDDCLETLKRMDGRQQGLAFGCIF